jgi:hypothetical protein
MHGTRSWRRPTSVFLALPAAGLLVWGILGGGPMPGAPGAAGHRETVGVVPAAAPVASATQPAPSGRWCDEGLGCTDM